MKILALAILVIATSCSAPKTISSLTVTSTIDEKVGKVSTGDSFQLTVEAADSDGIESISIDIPAVGSYDFYDNLPDGKWKNTQTLQIDSSAVRGVSEITVMMVDKQGEEKTITTPLIID